MKRILLAATSVFVLSTAAFAAIDITALDMDGDSAATFEEVTAKAPALTKVEFDELDLNKNNMLDANELTGEAQALLVRYMEGQAETGDVMSLDTDGDSLLTMEEILAAAPSVTQSEFDEVDTNDNNKWEANELTGPAQGYLRRDMGSASSAGTFDLASLDTNGDNGASMEEIMAANPKVSKEEFVEVDANGNNMWDSEEILTTIAQGYLGRR